MKLTRIALAVLCLAAAVTVTAAQTTGGLRVVVVDASDESPLPGATVVLTNDKQYVSETVELTNSDGIAEFPILRAGTGYIVQATMPGYAPQRRSDIRVSIGGTADVIIALGEEFVEVEKVVATSDVVDLEKSNTSTNFGDEFIQDLPVQGRFYTNVLTLAPGVQDSDGDGNPNVHGARERDFATLVGGVSNVDPLTGLQLQNVNMDSIEEIDVITAGAGVEFGRAQGGFANIIQKQGSNEFEGLFNFIFRSSLFDGNGATNLEGDQVPDFEWVQPALQLSGPIMRDKLWYRVSLDYRKREDPVATGSSLAVTTTTQNTNDAMVTWQASRRNKLAFQYREDPLTVENSGVDSTTPPEATPTLEFGGPTYSLQWTAPYSSKLLVDSIVAYTDYETAFYPSSRGVNNTCLTGNPILEAAQCFDLVTGQTTGSFFIDHRDKRQRFTARSQANIFGGRFWGSSHQFKVGFTIENERYYRERETRPNVVLFPLDSQTDDTGQIDSIAIAATNVTVPEQSTMRAVGTNWAIYGEDQIKPLPNLTLTVGARVDHEIINSNGFLPFDPEQELSTYLDGIEEGVIDSQVLLNTTFTRYEGLLDFISGLSKALGLDDDAINKVLEPSTLASTFWVDQRQLGNVDIVNTNVSPYLSLSWDPFKTNKTKFAFAIGRHYDKIFLAIPASELIPPNTDVNFIATPTADRWLVGPTPCAGQGGACLKPAANVTLVDRNLQTPYQDEFTFSFERELAAETSLIITYIKRNFENGLQDTDINHNSFDWGTCEMRPQPGGGPLSSTLVPSPGSGQEVTDLFTGEVFIDTDPGDGDGRLDDCIGRIVPPTGNQGGGGGGGGTPPSLNQFTQLPDGFADAYILNPGWGEMFLIGNFNSAEYNGVEVKLNRRQYRNWQMQASYVWSEAIGDAEDFTQQLGNDRSILKDERGYLSYDQRHVVKFNATTIVPWAGGFRIGTAIQWQSGLPYSILEQRFSGDAVPPGTALAAPERRARRLYVTGQRNDQRNEGWWNFDVSLAKEFNLKGGVNMQFRFDVFNLLNDNTLRVFVNNNGFNGQVRRFGRRYQLGLRVAF